MSGPVFLSELGPAVFTLYDARHELNLSYDATEHLLRRRAHNGELERFLVYMRDTRFREILAYGYRVPKAKTLDWDEIKRIVARRSLASTLPLIRKTSTRSDYDKLWNTQPSTTTRRLKELVQRGVLKQSYKRIWHGTGLSSVAAFYGPTKPAKERR